MKAKFSVVMTIILALSMLLSACGQSGVNSGSQAPVQSESQAPSSQEGTQVTTDKAIRMYAAEGGSSRAFKKAAEDFEAKTGIKVDVQVYAYADLREKQILELRNKSSNIDLVVVDGPIWLNELKGFLEPVDGYVKKDGLDLNIYVPSMLNMMKSATDGSEQLYGLPIRIAPWVLMYRTDLFEQKGLTPPKTYDDFLNVAKALTGDGKYGFAASFKQGNYLVAQWLPFLYSYGGNILNGEMKKAEFNSKAGVDSLQYLVDLYKKAGVIPPSAIDSEQDGIITSMQQGLTSMAITYAPYYMDINDPKKTEFAGKFAVAPYMPYSASSGLSEGVTEISGWGFSISRYSENKDAAWEFLKFAGSLEEQKKLAVSNNNSPTVEAVFSDPDYLAVYPDAGSVLSIAKAARLRPGTPKWTSVEDVLAREISAAVNDIKTVENALSDAEKEINATIGQ